MRPWTLCVCCRGKGCFIVYSHSCSLFKAKCEKVCNTVYLSALGLNMQNFGLSEKAARYMGFLKVKRSIGYAV